MAKTTQRAETDTTWAWNPAPVRFPLDAPMTGRQTNMATKGKGKGKGKGKSAAGRSTPRSSGGGKKSSTKKAAAKRETNGAKTSGAKTGGKRSASRSKGATAASTWYSNPRGKAAGISGIGTVAITATGVKLVDAAINRFSGGQSPAIRALAKYGAGWALREYGDNLPIIGEHTDVIGLIFEVLGVVDGLTQFVFPHVAGVPVLGPALNGGSQLGEYFLSDADLGEYFETPVDLNAPSSPLDADVDAASNPYM